ncbi:COBRA 4 [Olea europaea subsp. europaea]|uniref:COBRA 4 n=1 Tax=Olea europaea subsp. europaea TaxID=158383 RepID=A0A8S0VGS3_OLEEU|nr:COBRA 4 [Olea europaea subsp. europaea]
MRFLITAWFLCVLLSCAAAYDPLDPNGNITIKWDIMSWTPDGYVIQTPQYVAALTEFRTGIAYERSDFRCDEVKQSDHWIQCRKKGTRSPSTRYEKCRRLVRTD